MRGRSSVARREYARRSVIAFPPVEKRADWPEREMTDLPLSERRLMASGYLFGGIESADEFVLMPPKSKRKPSGFLMNSI